MDTLRALQLLTDLAYLALGIAALAAAVRSRERARVDVAIVFGALGLAVALQEFSLLSCSTPTGCLSLPLSVQVLTILVLVLPSALLRLVDDISDVPRWQMWLYAVLFAALALSVAAAGPAPGWFNVLLLLYLVLGIAHSAWAFGRRAVTTSGITRRRMAAAAWGCGLMVAALVLGATAGVAPRDQLIFTALSRLAGVASGLCFWAGFFPPNWLRQTWRVPELLGYLRPTRLMALPSDRNPSAADAMAIERLCGAAAATTGARRTILLLQDPVRHDLYLWGAPSQRVGLDHPLIAEVLRSSRPTVLRSVTPDQFPSAIVSVFASERLPRTAMLVPVAGEDHNLGILTAFAEKGPMFLEDDVELVSFFAAEAAAVLRMQRYRQSASELEALREADKLKDEFMAVVSHELRTPLTAISGYSDILVRKLSGPLNERQERQVAGIRDAARRLLALINDLLDVSKLEAGTLDLHVAALDARSVMSRAVAGVRVIASAKGVSIELREPPDDLPPVRADDERLQQILTNLLVNAIKFTPQGGCVWLSASAEAGPHGTEIAFRVQDTGIGLRPTELARVWDRFYQVESSTTRRFGGAGLGLSIVRRLVELHAGRVDASSAGKDQGSTFTVHLPAAIGPDAVPGKPVAPAALVANGNTDTAPAASSAAPVVLVVEDDVHIATVLQTYLQSEGYRVQIAEDGQQALQAARALRPFAITLDISLPKLDGWSVLNALKRDPATAAIPVIIVSMVDNRQFGLVLGATDYLVKPIDHERLRSALRNLDSARKPGDGSVLIVDDDPALRDVLTSVLAEDGWRVAAAADGEAALAALDHETPAAMVLDLMMPRVDGFQVLQTVRARPATRDLPIIVVTARDLTEEDRERLARGAERVILKQAVPIDQLREEIRAVLLARRAHNGEPARRERDHAE